MTECACRCVESCAVDCTDACACAAPDERSLLAALREWAVGVIAAENVGNDPCGSFVGVLEDMLVKLNELEREHAAEVPSDNAGVRLIQRTREGFAEMSHEARVAEARRVGRYLTRRAKELGVMVLWLEIQDNMDAEMEAYVTAQEAEQAGEQGT